MVGKLIVVLIENPATRIEKDRWESEPMYIYLLGGRRFPVRILLVHDPYALSAVEQSNRIEFAGFWWIIACYAANRINKKIDIS